LVNIKSTHLLHLLSINLSHWFILWPVPINSTLQVFLHKAATKQKNSARPYSGPLPMQSWNGR